MARSRQNSNWFARVLGRLWRRPETDFGPRRGAVTHVVILDGTMSSLTEGFETNVGLSYKLMREMGSALSIYYEPGLQWHDWRSTRDVLMGRGINRQIRRAYGYLASRYRPGDRVFFFGYSRGAYAVRSLAGVIDRVGLLRPEEATERNIRDVYRHYEGRTQPNTIRAFRQAHCLDTVEIEMIGAWDTVKSLGINAPILWRLSERHHAFHNHDLSGNVKNGFHALAMNETRMAYAPILWRTDPAFAGRLEQMWFPGTHGDVGGQLGGFEAARPLSNIPLVWMLDRAVECGLPLPEGWRARFPRDAHAPSVGTWRGYGRVFVTRRRRKHALDPSEKIHSSVPERAAQKSARKRFSGLRFPGRMAKG